MSRLDKVNSQLKREISQIIHQELADPRLQFVTILAVEVSKDLQHARVFFSVLGDKKKVQLAKTALDNVRGLIRRKLSQRITLRYFPELLFFYDQSTEISARIEEKLEEIKNESKERNLDSQEE